MVTHPDPDRIQIDFETYYEGDYSLKKMNVTEYVGDGRFSCYLVSVAEFNTEGEILRHTCLPPESVDKDLWEHWSRQKALSHNARFDSAVWTRLMELGIIPDTAPNPEIWDCTADLAGFFRSSRRGLEESARVLLGTETDKRYREVIDGVTSLDSVEPDVRKVILDGALADNVTSFRLWKKFNPAWPENQQRFARKTRQAAERGIRIDMPLLKENQGMIRQSLFEYEQEIPYDWSDNLTPTSSARVADQCRIDGVPPPPNMQQDDTEFLEWVETNGAKVPWIAALGKWKKAYRIGKILDRLERSVDARGMVDIFPFELKYAGAHTNRLSGSGGYNMQNQNNREVEGVNIRHLLIPRPGHVFIDWDLGQIEPRCLRSRVGDTDFINFLKAGYHPYEAHARVNGLWTRPEKLAATDPDLYKFCKAREIALGYRVGAKKFVTMASIYGLNPEDAFGKTPVTPEDINVFDAWLTGTRQYIFRKEFRMADAKTQQMYVNSWKAVTDFREKNDKITAFWKELIDSMKIAAFRKMPVWKLPLRSGRCLYYFQPHERRSIDKEATAAKALADIEAGTSPGKTEVIQSTNIVARVLTGKGAEWKTFHGGKLTENAIQAEGMDCCVHKILQIDSETGFFPLFSVHDQALNEVPTKDAERLAKEMQDILRDDIPWLDGCPVDGSVQIIDKFTK